jgi:NAD(P)-dependent dehydrogenase (short-subunit alcohol dehydrogenase family)
MTEVACKPQGTRVYRPGSDFDKVIIARTPHDRIGRPNIARAAVFFPASDGSVWLTGERLRQRLG